jgi:hypothetical protein
MESCFSISIKSGKLLMVQLQVTNAVSDSEAAHDEKSPESWRLRCLVMCHLVDQLRRYRRKEELGCWMKMRVCSTFSPRQREEKNIAFGWGAAGRIRYFCVVGMHPPEHDVGVTLGNRVVVSSRRFCFGFVDPLPFSCRK